MKKLAIIICSILFLSFNDYCCDLSKLYGKWQIAEVEENNKVYLAKNFNDCNRKETIEFKDSTCIEIKYSYAGSNCFKEKHIGNLNYKLIRVGQDNNKDKDFIEIFVRNKKYKILVLNDTILKLWSEYPNFKKTYRRMQK